MAKSRVEYPLLTSMVEELARDNYGIDAGRFVKPRRSWVWPAEAAELEAQAAKLSEDERLTLACGEHTEQLAVIRKHGVASLSEFMAAVFDGVLHYNFFKEV